MRCMQWLMQNITYKNYPLISEIASTLKLKPLQFACKFQRNDTLKVYSIQVLILFCIQVFEKYETSLCIKPTPYDAIYNATLEE